MGRYEDLQEALANAKSEREIAAFLNKDLYWLRWLNEYSWNFVITKAEFSIGTEYRADYIVLSACSGCWNCVLIEMQSPTDPIFTKKGEASKQLREAQRQLQDWMDYIHFNEFAFRKQLSKLVDGVSAKCSRVDVHQRADTEILDQRTYINYKYKVLIGRRSFLSIENNKRRNYFEDIEIVTFDRLLDFAQRCDNPDMLFEDELWT